MKNNIIFVLFYLMGFFWSCSGGSNSIENKEQKAGIVTDSTGNIFVTGVEVEPVLALADSVQIIYYDDPLGDSLRYSRFFTYVSTADTIFLNTLKKEMEQISQVAMSVRNCRSEGKIYLFDKGEPVKTIFFSSLTSQCQYLYFIKNGLFYYLDLKPDFSEELRKLRSNAIKP